MPPKKKPILLDNDPVLKRKIAKAAQADADRRDLAFLTDAPRVLCGVPVKALTLRHLILLFLSRSPFVCGGQVRVEHVIQFIDIVSVGFEAGKSKVQRARRHKLIERMLRAKFAAAIKQIDEFMDDAWKDRASRRSSGPAEVVSIADAMVHEFAWAYGWMVDYTLDRPLAQLYALLRHIAREHDPKAPLFAGSAKVKGDFLRKLAKKKGGNK